ncbi:hypothetical protein I6N90_01165 [Paenibacillus sp. GSMTC-2017]|uniref:hypothetical protein n=1 Tax=Paenibacillus sp. GSMTC-2017 TaxID=2794350 RepID=UPI0018D80501|nr:hypothetical protein [Paenibacillus sp. GSMTC-2017]MBH5316414.1 hypothetical protein [Paenibacillus sp. GSMTC-2017]
MLLDRYLPNYQFYEKHQIEVYAEREEVFRAILNMKEADIFILRLLFRIRTIPAWLIGKSRMEENSGTFIKGMLKNGFVMLEEIVGQEFIVGAVGAFWKPVGNKPILVKSAEEFITLNDPSLAKAVMNFQLQLQPNGKLILLTETRIQTNSKTTWLKFYFYWLLIYPGSALIRHMLLRAIKAKAEKD